MNRLPLNVSSKLTNLEASATALQLTAYANATPTAEKAPVLVAVQSAKHIDADAFANQLCAEGGQGTPAQARLLVNALASVFGTLVETYGAITVNTPFGTVQTFITGTLENPQDQPDPATNYAFLAVVVPEVYRKLFASFETYVPAEACPVTLRRVRDKATDRPGICGTQPFYLEGSGMTFGGDGEKLELLDPVTKELVATATVDLGSATKIQFACTLAGTAAVSKGKYVLRLTTLAGGESTLWPADLEVELLESIPAPEPEPIAETPDGQVKVMSATDGGQGATFTFGHEWKIGGVNMFDGAHRPADIDWTLSEVGMQLGEGEFHILDATYAADGTLITVDSSGSSTTPEPGTYDDARICIMAQKTGEGDPIGLNIPVRIVVEG